MSITPSFVSVAPSLTQDDIERFSRQILLEEIGAKGMERIKAGRVVCVGAGGLGSTIALYLTAAGVGRLTLVDFDVVEASNLHRQVIHTTDRIGQLKVESARQACLAINHSADIRVVPEAFSLNNAERLVQDCDVVVDGSDNVATRYLVNDATMQAGKTLVSGCAMRWDGQLSVYGHGGGPCYRCLFPQPPPPAAVGSCNDTGVMGPVPGMIGCLQALEVLKILAGAGEPLSGRMLLFDGLRMRMRVVQLRGKQSSCSACGKTTVSHSQATDHPEYIPQSCAVSSSRALISPTLCSSPQEFATQWLYAPQRATTSDTWVLCVDVRTPTQYDMAHLPGAHSLPLGTLRQWKRNAELPARWLAFLTATITADIKQRSITAQWEEDLQLEKCYVFLICRRGVASAQTVQLLQSICSPTVAIGPFSLAVALRSVDGGLNAYSRQVDKLFPYY